MTVRTTDPLVPPVTAQELADFSVIDATDPSIPSVLIMATDAVIQFLNLDLTPRAYTLTHWDWPSTGARTHPNLTALPYRLNREIMLPFAGLVSVESVEVYGVATTLFTARERSLVFSQGVPFNAHKSNEDPAIVVEYTAGLDPIPAAIKQAVIMLAAFLYEHRGACDMPAAFTMSGARQMLQPWTRDAVVFG